ncbi:MAG TPA: carbon starvation protein A [Blastocatellia bacterium]|jgi:carbon starvation protein|nr:carbon starvation protein A [Blastocatellia bacterium]HAF23665.1 carbon starvation protein A [Blastocatellia bacterium]
MNALPIIIGSLCVIAIAYRYYSAFIAAKVLALDDSRPVPSQTMYDGHNYYPTNKWVLFGHHFAAISGAGPLIGPVLAAQFGFLPGLLWLVIGVCLGGAVHDFMILVGSIRRKGKSLAEMARTEISPLSGFVAGMAILFIVVIALAGLGLVVVNALAESPWGTFTVGFTIPLALFMGLYMYRFRKGKIAEASVIGVIGLLAAVYLGGRVADSSFAGTFTFSRNTIVILMAAYGFIASVLPVWMLLCPRDYLSSYLKLGTIAFLIIGVILVHPNLNMPALTPFTGGGGPVIPGKLYPFVFITIACGAISGFHALISSGTTPKMIAKESDARLIGYGSMLMEGVVGVVALIAATSLFPGDYFAINTAQKTDAQKAAYVRMVDEHSAPGFNLQPKEIDRLEQESGEKNLRGRTGGAVTLALGIAKIFDGIPGLRGLMKYWYHFAIMFEALFILTTIDTGTRVARFLVGEFGGRFHRKLEEPNWLPGSVITSALVVAAWAAFIWSGSISTIWPMFGVANQLLAAVALCVATTIIINSGKAKYSWVTILPLTFVGSTTLVAGWESITDIFWPLSQKPETAVQGYINTFLTAIIMVAAVIILIDSIRRWFGLGKRPEPIVALAEAELSG